MKINMLKINITAEHLGQYALYPAYGSDLEKLHKYSQGEIMQVVTKQPRNLKLHNKWMAMLRLVVANNETWRSVDQLRYWLKFKLGLGTYKTGRDGELVFIPTQLDFESMEEYDFQERVYEPSLPLLAEEAGICTWELVTNNGEYL